MRIGGDGEEEGQEEGEEEEREEEEEEERVLSLEWKGVSTTTMIEKEVLTKETQGDLK